MQILDPLFFGSTLNAGTYAVFQMYKNFSESKFVAFFCSENQYSEQYSEFDSENYSSSSSPRPRPARSFLHSALSSQVSILTES